MPDPIIDLDTRFRILRALQDNPEITQRDLAGELGMSLGKTNYCLRALIEKGWIKVANFHRSQHKHRYLYNLTPAGITEKTRITHRFLKRKLREHRALTSEIERLRAELE